MPCGPWTLDLLFASARVVVELDGDTHAAASAAARDARRDAWLSERGYRTLRFTNRDVLGNPEGVLATIAAALAERAASPPLPPAGERRGEDRHAPPPRRPAPAGPGPHPTPLPRAGEGADGDAP